MPSTADPCPPPCGNAPASPGSRLPSPALWCVLGSLDTNWSSTPLMLPPPALFQLYANGVVLGAGVGDWVGVGDGVDDGVGDGVGDGDGVEDGVGLGFAEVDGAGEGVGLPDGSGVAVAGGRGPAGVAVGAGTGAVDPPPPPPQAARRTIARPAAAAKARGKPLLSKSIEATVIVATPSWAQTGSGGCARPGQGQAEEGTLDPHLRLAHWCSMGCRGTRGGLQPASNNRDPAPKDELGESHECPFTGRK